MSLLRIRHPVTGEIIITEEDFISRHLLSIELAHNDLASHSIRLEGLLTGKPYYLYDPNGILHAAPIMDYNTNALGHFMQINVSFSGDTCTYQQRWMVTGDYNSMLYEARRDGRKTYLHIGVF